MKKILAFLSAVLAVFVRAEVADLTSSLEYVGNPNAARWSEVTKRPVTDLKVYDGKLFVSGGATELNAGPCPLQHIDPYTKKITVEGSAGTENISVFKVFSDGRLYVPSQDPRDYDADYSDDGHVFVRNPAGDWKFYKNVPKQSLKDKGSEYTEAYVHNWDMEEYDGRIFVAGYGLAWTTNGCASWTSATPHWKSSRMDLIYAYNIWDYTKKKWKTAADVTVQPSLVADGYGTYRREVQFMKFNDRLFAVPFQCYPFIGVPKSVYDAPIEIHRYDETTKRFVQMTNTSSRVFAGGTTNDFKMVVPMTSILSDAPYRNTALKLWHTTPFSNRVFYVVSPYDTYTNLWGSARKGYGETQYPYPMFACAADPSADGMFTSQRIDFGNEVYPFDFLEKNGALYALTAKYDKTDKKVWHSVWRSTDARTFTELFTFKFHQYLISMEYFDGKFYFGAGYKGASQVVYQLDSTADASGSVYRVPFPMETNTVRAETDLVTAIEGEKGSVRFRLASAPATNVTLRVWTTGNPSLVAKTSALTFSTSDWSDWKTVSYEIVQDTDIGPHPVGMIFCGTGGSDFTTAFVQVQAEDDDDFIENEDQIPEKRDYLVYEGFSTNDYKPVTSGYGTIVTGGPTGTTDAIGTAPSATKWDASGSSQLLWFKAADGLSLPRAMRLAGFKSRGTAVGTNPGTNSSNCRSAYRPLADGVLSPTNTPTGKYCFRVLLNVDKTAFGVAKKEGWLVSASNTTETSVNAYGAGFCRKTSGKNYGAHLTEPSTVGFYLARNTNNVLRVYLRTVSATGEIKSKVLGEAKTDVTYVCYAEVDLKEGADIIRAGYQSVYDYTTDIPWMGESTNDVFTATSYPTAMAFGGCYGTSGGYFRADEFAVGTSLRSVLATSAAPVASEPPQIGGGAASDTGVSFGTDAQGNAAFGVSVANAQKGLWYRAYVAERLGDAFRPFGMAVQATADGVLPVLVPTEGKASLFVKIVVSATGEWGVIFSC